MKFIAPHLAGKHLDFSLIFCFSILIQCVGYDHDLNMYDEGIILTGASAVFRGEIPYKDFWTMYGPGQFYLLSWLFHVFGETNFALRIIGLLSKAIIVAFTFCLIIRMVGRLWWALLGALLVLGMLLVLKMDGFPVFPALAFSMAAILTADLGVRRAERYFLVAGICSGIAACFRHDLGAYGLIAMVFAFYVVNVANGQGLKYSLRQLYLYAGGVALIVVPVGGYFICQVPTQDLVENLVTIPSTIYPVTRRLPWPSLYPFNFESLNSLLVYVPFLIGWVVVIIGFSNVRLVRQRVVRISTEESSRWFLLAAVTITCLIFTLKGAVRVQPVHMSQSLVLAVPLAIYVWMLSSGIKAGVWRWVIRLIVLICLLPMAMMVKSGAMVFAKGAKDLLLMRGDAIGKCLNPEFLRAPCVNIDPGYSGAAKFLANNAAPNEPIYVGVGRHDRIFINAVSFYFLVGHPPATKWAELHPGVQTQERIQRMMIDEFEHRPPKFVVIDGRWDGISEPNASSESSGVRLIDEYIAKNYRRAYVRDTVKVMERVVATP